MSTTALHTTMIECPLGVLTIHASDEGVRVVKLPGEDADRVRIDDPIIADANDIASDAAGQLEEYFAGTRREFTVPLEPEGTEFQRAAWTALRAIPYGETASYGEQARRLGDGRRARAVGAANGRNPIPIIVPCHRVIGADGSLTGFGGGIDAKAWLLAHERRHAGLTLDFG